MTFDNHSRVEKVVANAFVGARSRLICCRRRAGGGMKDLFRGLTMAHIGNRARMKVRAVEGSERKSLLGNPRGLYVMRR